MTLNSLTLQKSSLVYDSILRGLQVHNSILEALLVHNSILNTLPIHNSILEALLVHSSILDTLPIRNYILNTLLVHNSILDALPVHNSILKSLLVHVDPVVGVHWGSDSSSKPKLCWEYVHKEWFGFFGGIWATSTRTEKRNWERMEIAGEIMDL